MEVFFKEVASVIALGLEMIAILLIAAGGVEALYGTVKVVIQGGPGVRRKKEVWLRFGVWLLLGLEFELAADIIRTAIAPTWVDIGQLGGIAAIRTFLNYFLEKDLEKYGEGAPEKA